MERLLARRAIIQRAPLLGSLTEDQVHALACGSRIARYRRGESIWQHGREVPFFGIVGDGFVRMARSSAQGNELTLDIMGPGQVFGLLGTVDGQGCPLMAYALTEVVLLKGSKRALLEIYGENHILKDGLVRRTSIRMHQKLDLMARMSTGTVEERIAAILVTLAEAYGEPCADAVVLELPLTRRQIGEMAGTTTESTIRVLSRWEKQGWITTVKQQILIRELGRLRTV